MKTRLASAAIAMTLLAGCRSKGPDYWSCNIPSRQACSEWKVEGTDTATISKQQTSCAGMGGTVVQGRCPEANSIGTCNAGSGSTSRMVYYQPRDPVDARQSCRTLGGSWQ
jgi:hypothetical protein